METAGCTKSSVTHESSNRRGFLKSGVLILSAATTAKIATPSALAIADVSVPGGLGPSNLSGKRTVRVGPADGRSDTRRIQAAINRASAIGKRIGTPVTVELAKANEYLMSQRARWDSNNLSFALEMASDVVLDLNGATLIWDTIWADQRCMISAVGGTTRWRVTNGSLNGAYGPAQKAEVQDHLIAVGGSTNWSVDHCVLTNMGGKAIDVNQVAGDYSAPRAARFSIFDNRISDGCSNAISVNYSRSFLISQNVVRAGRNAQIGTEWLIGDHISGFEITNNVSAEWGNTSLGPFGGHVSDGEISGNTIIAPPGLAEGNISLGSPSNVRIQSNRLDMRAGGQFANVSFYVGGDGRQVTGLSVVGNTLLSGPNQNAAIISDVPGLDTEVGVTISRNSICGATYGPAVMIPNTGALISGNVIEGSIQIGNKCKVLANIVRGGISSQQADCVAINGANNMVTDNTLFSAWMDGFQGVIQITGGPASFDNLVARNTLERTSSSGRGIYETAPGASRNTYTENLLVQEPHGCSIVGADGTFDSLPMTDIIARNVGVQNRH